MHELLTNMIMNLEGHESRMVVNDQLVVNDKAVVQNGKLLALQCQIVFFDPAARSDAAEDSCLR